MPLQYEEKEKESIQKQNAYHQMDLENRADEFEPYKQIVAELLRRHEPPVLPHLDQKATATNLTRESPQ